MEWYILYSPVDFWVTIAEPISFAVLLRYANPF
jgi:hypothetical protein